MSKVPLYTPMPPLVTGRVVRENLLHLWSRSTFLTSGGPRRWISTALAVGPVFPWCFQPGETRVRAYGRPVPMRLGPPCKREDRVLGLKDSKSRLHYS